MRNFSYVGLLKLAGPSWKDKASASVPGAKKVVAQQKHDSEYRRANPSAMGSLAQQKAWIRQQGQKALSRQTPEVQAKFWDDARKYQANAARFRAAAGAFMPGLGLIGASGMMGTGDTIASRIEGKDWLDSTKDGARSALMTYAGGKAADTGLRHAVGLAKRFIPRFRKFALRLNARDPYHNSLKTKVTNYDIPVREPAAQGDMYLSHAAAQGRLPQAQTSAHAKFNTAQQYISGEDSVMPSLGLTSGKRVTHYGSGYANGHGSFSDNSIPVRYYYDSSVLKKPRTVIFHTNDAWTPTYEGVRREYGNLADSAVRERMYSDLFSRSKQLSPNISAKDAVRLNKAGILEGDAGRVFEVKPYSDLGLRDIRAASIGTNGNLSEAGVARMEELLGDAGIPYYFTREPGNFRIPGMKYPEFVLSPEEMVQHFAPNITGL